MNILNIAIAVKMAMANNVETKTLLKEIDRVIESLDEGNTPRLLRQFGEAYKGDFNSNAVSRLLQSVSGQTKSLKVSDIFNQLAEVCDICVRELRSMRSLVNNDPVEVILRDNLEMKQGYILHFLASAEFLNRYLRTMLIVITELESAAFRKEEPTRNTMRYYSELLEPPRITSMGLFADYLLSHKKDKVIEDIYNMPALDVDEATIKAVTATSGAKVIDPSGLTATTVITSLLNLVNPIAWAYASQKLWSEFLLYRLEENESELRYLESRYQELIEQREHGGATVTTSTSIERYKEEITTIRAKVVRLRAKLSSERR